MNQTKKQRKTINVFCDSDIFIDSSQSFKDLQLELKKLRNRVSKF